MEQNNEVYETIKEEVKQDRPTYEWYEREIDQLNIKLYKLEFEKELLLNQLIRLTNNNPNLL